MPIHIPTDNPPPTPLIQFLPGQWLDVFVPGIDKPGGFTITSAPSKARGPTSGATAATTTTTTTTTSTTATSPYIELAVQKSPENVVAKWLWQPVDTILSSKLHVRVGGSFVWPPPGVMPTVGCIPERLLSPLSSASSSFLFFFCYPPSPSRRQHRSDQPLYTNAPHLFYGQPPTDATPPPTHIDPP